MRDEHDFFNGSGTIAIDDSIFFGVKAAAISGFISIASIVKTCRISVVAHGQDFAKVRTSDDSAHPESSAGGPLG